MTHKPTKATDLVRDRCSRGNMGASSGRNQTKYCLSATASGNLKHTHLRSADFVEDNKYRSLDEHRHLYSGTLGECRSSEEHKAGLGDEAG